MPYCGVTGEDEAPAPLADWNEQDANGAYLPRGDDQMKTCCGTQQPRRKAD